MVKSYLPFKDAHLRVGVDDLLGLLKNILSFGELSEDLESRLVDVLNMLRGHFSVKFEGTHAQPLHSSVDKAHLRLVAAKAVLRLSRNWDDKIPIEIFHLTLKTPEVPPVTFIFHSHFPSNPSSDLSSILTCFLNLSSRYHFLQLRKYSSGKFTSM